MPIWLLRNLNRSRCFYMPDTDGAGGGAGEGGADKSTGSDGNPTGDTGKQEGDNNNSIPKYRFDEVNEKYKAAKAELDKINAEKAKADEADALRRGEHEKLLAQKDQELADYKAKEEMWKAREDDLRAKNASRVESLKATYWESREKVSGLLDANDDPFKTSHTLDAIEAMEPKKADDQKPAPKWGSDIPSGNNQGRLAELKAKAERGERLTDRERKELYDLVEAKKA